ncbi:hypothetical protein GCM10025857_07030 [Alicyclobacillus contaminans]|uniref:hypothetical protein n=1 Tax=Alicyclobacillus contaminans TaxID=392016 RepID=UPI000426273F|nr:hypothetical protein [Alicyclobacillus contaminans]GMA49346.1 hypothetical protein GCM10025857_07030 [Alicyclobacillus contaminans]
MDDVQGLTTQPFYHWDIVEDIVSEYRRASEKFPPFNSAHEGYAVLLEEVDELWDSIKANDAAGTREEAVQVAAMALRFLIDVVGKSGTLE